MKSRLLVVISIFCLKLAAQEFVPCDSIKASYYCHEAPIICDIDCLDGFTDRMPDSLYTYGDPNLPNYPQPELLCFDPNTGSGFGAPSNMSWFAFIAGSTTIKLEIIPSACIQTNMSGFGLQGGIISGCALDSDGYIPDSLRVVCIEETTGDDPFTLVSSNFVPGQVYYIYIDGLAGTICDYTVDVKSGSQPFPLEEITNILDEENEVVDTFCVGQNVTLRPEVGQLNIDYFWRITPETPEFPDTFRNLGYYTDWSFQYPGAYEISVYATNGCDHTDTFKQMIYVELLPDEVFDTVDICFSDFPYLGPLTEDPNMDGVIGWQGDPIVYPGGDVEHIVTIAATGCSYTQKLQVNEIGPGQRINVTEVSCGPFDYHGTMITQTTLGQAINIPGATQDGCDSLVMLDAYIIDIDGEIEAIDCDSSGLKIGYVINSIEAPTGYELNYKWFDSTGELIDNDNVPGDIIIDKQDSYSVQIMVIVNQDTCTFDIAPKIIDPNDNKPSITAVDWTLNICDSDNIGSYKVTSDQATKVIQWSIPNGATIIEGDEHADFIKVDFTNSGSGNVRVDVENFCSGNSFLEFPVQITTTPVANFDLVDQICKDSSLTFESLEPFNPNYQYLWQIPSNAIITGGSLTSEGPVEIEFINGSGNYNIQLIIDNGGCKDSLNKSIELLDDIPQLNVSCTQSATSVTFNWDDEPCADSYTIRYNSEEFNIGNSTSHTIDNLMLNSSVDVEILINSNCLCSGPLTAATCMTLDCEDVEISLTTSQNLLCEDMWTTDLPINANVNGGTPSGTLTYEGDFVDPSGSFNAISAGAGIHTVIAKFEEDGCVYLDSTTITLFDQPTAGLDIYDPQCIDELFGSIDLNVTGGDGNYTIMLDDEMVTNDIDELSIGDHTIQIIDGNSCEVVKTFTINAPPSIDYSIEGKREIFESEPMSFLLDYTMSEVALVDSIAWYLNDELICVGLDCNTFFIDALEPGEYDHNIIIYYNDCIIEESFQLLVKESINVFLPEAFSPNNDGYNDHWFIATNDPSLEIRSCTIFNRWGNVVFNKRNFIPFDEKELWDATFNGKKVQPGVYVYSIEYIDEFGSMKTITKDLTILY